MTGKTIESTRRGRYVASGAVAVALLVAAIAPADASARRTRPGGGGSSSGGTRPSGHATYGHYRGGHYGYQGGYGQYGGYYGGYGRYGGYGYRVGVGLYGWPYYGYGGPYWGWGYPARTVYVARGATPGTRPGAVELDVQPKKAEVRLDGNYVGQARDFNGRWDLLWLKPGRHVVELGREGYRTLRLHLEVEAGDYSRLAERLDKGEGLDPRSSDPPVESAVPAEARSAPAPAPAPIPREPSLKRALLKLEVLPPDAAVYLDGEFLARADELNRLHGAIPVAEGPHAVEVVRPGYRSERLEVQVLGPDPVRLEVGLTRER